VDSVHEWADADKVADELSVRELRLAA